MQSTSPEADRRQVLGLLGAAAVLPLAGALPAAAALNPVAPTVQLGPALAKNVRLVPLRNGRLIAGYEQLDSNGISRAAVAFARSGDLTLRSRVRFAGSQGAAVPVPEANGSGIVFYVVGGGIGATTTIRARRFGRDRVFIGKPFDVSRNKEGINGLTAVRLAGGSIIVGYVTDDDTFIVFRVNRLGRKATENQIVARKVAGSSDAPVQIAALTGGGAVAVFAPAALSGRKPGARLITSGGKPRGDVIEFGDGGLFSSAASVAALSDNRFAIVWAADDILSNDDLLIQVRSGSSGRRLFGISVSLTADAPTAPPLLAQAPNGDLVVAVSEIDGNQVRLNLVQIRQSGRVVSAREIVTAAASDDVLARPLDPTSIVRLADGKIAFAWTYATGGDDGSLKSFGASFSAT